MTSNPCIQQQKIVLFQKKTRQIQHSIQGGGGEGDGGEGILLVRTPSDRKNTHAASPRPLARTKRIRFPGWGDVNKRRTNPKPPTYKTTLWVIRRFGVGGADAQQSQIQKHHTYQNTQTNKWTNKQINKHKN